MFGPVTWLQSTTFENYRTEKKLLCGSVDKTFLLQIPREDIPYSKNKKCRSGLNYFNKTVKFKTSTSTESR
jgi:hypothetical protein